jgi:hypothetical protein
MRNGFIRGAMVGMTVTAVVAFIAVSGAQPTSQGTRPARIDGRPNLSGIWQANNEANWDLQAHEARAGAVMQPGVYPYDFAQVPAAPSLPFGAAGGVPGSLGVVQGDGQIPYKPEALARKQDNAAHWLDRDPELKCQLPGAPRAMYMPYPYQIVQGTNKIQILFAFSNAARVIHLDSVAPPPIPQWMGHSVGRWEGDTLVVEVTELDEHPWFDRAGNFHSDALRLVERYSLITPDAIRYEATIEDPNVFTRPWTISMPIYRRLEPNMQVLHYRCTPFVEEYLFGHLRKEPLVRRWQGETMTVEITRPPVPPEKSYERISGVEAR